MSAAKRLVFEGELDLYARGNWRMGTTVRIGGRDVIEEVEKAFRMQEVRVILGTESLEGELWAIEGFSGTDVTPAEPPEFTVGGRSVLGRLRDLPEGKTVALTVEAANPTQQSFVSGDDEGTRG